MAAGEVAKWLLGKGDTALAGAEVQFNLAGYRSLRTNFVRKENCRGPHSRWRVVELQQAPQTLTLAELLKGRIDAQLLVKAEVPWITRGACWSCGKVHPVRRFSRLGRRVARCPCGGVIWADLDGRRSIIPSEDLAEISEKPLLKLGLKPSDSLAICDDEDWTWFVLS
jgi:hypothetical protein